MAVERFRGGLMWQEIGGLPELAARWNPVLVVLTTASGVQEIRHGLNRVPRGMLVVNVAAPAGTGQAVGWYREVDDDPWTETLAPVRWEVAGAEVVVAFF